jgi:hypothetical protein
MSNAITVGEPYFFGAYMRSGHYCHNKHMSHIWDDRVSSIDGKLVDNYATPYEVVRTVLDGSSIKTKLDGLGYVAYSFVDYTSDSRGGSNSNFLFIEKEDYIPLADRILKNFPRLASWYNEKQVTLIYNGRPVILNPNAVSYSVR